MQLMVTLDQQKLLARHLTPTDIHDALRRQDLVLPAGDQRSRSRTGWSRRCVPLQVEDFDKIPIKREGNAFIYMRDVAMCNSPAAPQTNAVLVDGKQSVILVVMKSGEASTLEVVDGIKKTIPRIEKSRPRV